MKKGILYFVMIVGVWAVRLEAIRPGGLNEDLADVRAVVIPGEFGDINYLLGLLDREEVEEIENIKLALIHIHGFVYEGSSMTGFIKQIALSKLYIYLRHENRDVVNSVVQLIGLFFTNHNNISFINNSLLYEVMNAAAIYINNALRNGAVARGSLDKVINMLALIIHKKQEVRIEDRRVANNVFQAFEGGLSRGNIEDLEIKTYFVYALYLCLININNEDPWVIAIKSRLYGHVVAVMDVCCGKEDYAMCVLCMSRLVVGIELSDEQKRELLMKYLLIVEREQIRDERTFIYILSMFEYLLLGEDNEFLRGFDLDAAIVDEKGNEIHVLECMRKLFRYEVKVVQMQEKSKQMIMKLVFSVLAYNKKEGEYDVEVSSYSNLSDDVIKVLKSKNEDTIKLANYILSLFIVHNVKLSGYSNSLKMKFLRVYVDLVKRSEGFSEELVGNLKFNILYILNSFGDSKSVPNDMREVIFDCVMSWKKKERIGLATRVLLEWDDYRYIKKEHVIEIFSMYLPFVEDKGLLKVLRTILYKVLFSVGHVSIDIEKFIEEVLGKLEESNDLVSAKVYSVFLRYVLERSDMLKLGFDYRKSVLKRILSLRFRDDKTVGDSVLVSMCCLLEGMEGLDGLNSKELYYVLNLLIKRLDGLWKPCFMGKHGEFLSGGYMKDVGVAVSSVLSTVYKKKSAFRDFLVRVIHGLISNPSLDEQVCLRVLLENELLVGEDGKLVKLKLNLFSRLVERVSFESLDKDMYIGWIKKVKAYLNSKDEDLCNAGYILLNKLLDKIDLRNSDFMVRVYNEVFRESEGEVAEMRALQLVNERIYYILKRDLDRRLCERAVDVNTASR